MLYKKKSKTSWASSAKLANLDIPLSSHFTLAQLTYSRTAKKKRINNAPSKKAVKNLKLLADGLEQVRALLGHPITISSGYRCRTLNTAVGGSKTSQHVLGLAADFVCKRFGTPYLTCKKIANSDIQFDQLIHEYGRSRKEQWIHISFGPKRRRNILTICASEGLSLDGLHRDFRR